MNQSILAELILYLLIVNIIALILMKVDKQKAINHQWRISERTLFTAAILGGSIGIYIGMQMFRHKTKHKSFVIGIPVIFIVEVIMAVYSMI